MFLPKQGGNLEEELLLLEQQVKRNEAEMEEEEFWQNELQIEQESEQQLRQKLAELQGGVRDCEAKLEEYLARIQVSLAPAQVINSRCGCILNKSGITGVVYCTLCCC